MARLPAVALRGPAARRARGRRAAAARSSAATAPASPTSSTHGENGLLVDPDDAAELADALVRILSDRGEAERLGAAARRTGEEWGVDAGASTRAQVAALVRGVLAALT